MHLILTGVTGVVGSAVLSHILSLPATSSISRISILTRNSVPLLSPTHANLPIKSNPNLKIDVITHNDYSTYPPLAAQRRQRRHLGPRHLAKRRVERGIHQDHKRLHPSRGQSLQQPERAEVQLCLRVRRRRNPDTGH